MSKFTKFLTASLICAVFGAGTAFGSEMLQIPIHSFEELRKIGKDQSFPLGVSYVLMNDIDASPSRGMNDGKGFEPIEAAGDFDGNGYVIRGLYINRPDEDSVGLFRHIRRYSGGSSMGPDGPIPWLSRVRNLVIEADSIIGRNYVGVLAGSSDGIVQDVHTAGNVRGAKMIGGVVGANSGTVRKSGSSANVYSHVSPLSGSSAGGLAGVNIGTIDSSRASGNVFGGRSRVGGLVGFNDISTAEDVDFYAALGAITNSYATGNVTSMEGNAGGLVGTNAGRIERSYATGAVNAAMGVAGGLVGYNATMVSPDVIPAMFMGGHIRDTYATGDVTAPIYAGGLIGYNRVFDELDFAPQCMPTFLITTSYAVGRVTGDSLFGGLIGFNERPWVVANSFWDVTTSGVDTSAGGEGKTTAEMMMQATFNNEYPGGGLFWDFQNVWRINEGESYPYFIYQDATTTSIFRDRVTSTRNRTNAAMPAVSVRGRTLNVKLPSSMQSSSTQNLQVRMINMRGRTAASFKIVNGIDNSFLLTKIPAGRYIVEVRNAGGRVGSTPVVVR